MGTILAETQSQVKIQTTKTMSGNEQGNLFSPMQFNITLEHMMRDIRTNMDGTTYVSHLQIMLLTQVPSLQPY